MKPADVDYIALLKTLTDIGVALSVEKDHKRLLEFILIQAKSLTNADAATLYECVEGKLLKFEIIITESLHVHAGGTSERKITLSPLPLFKNGKPNRDMVATTVFFTKKPINIEDAYHNKAFDFSGTYQADKENKYHSQSFLTVPLINHLDEVIGVLQLINAREPGTTQIIPFSELDEQIVHALSSQVAISITKNKLINAQKELFDSLIQLVASAIDEKSPYTANHCRRVPVLTQMIAEAACQADYGPLKEFTLTTEEIYEVEVAAWLHDCGKIAIPEYVVDKATKLETIFDRIHLVDTRFEVLKRDARIAYLTEPGKKDEEALKNTLSQLEEDRQFIHKCNIGKEFISQEDILRINRIASQRWEEPSGALAPLLSEEEILNLAIPRGTLTLQEREVINSHVSITAKLLNALPYPKNLKRVPEFAAGHHEKLDGTGYPQGLSGETLPMQSRMIAIADIFEALTASDRPYKKAMPLSQCLKILGEMKLSGHIDPNLFDIFIEEKIYLRYARQYLDEKLIDEFDIKTIPGYCPVKNKN
ncbi:MAG: HD domain-containing phosphohydrolase [Tatlockia sp.]|jgi:HD-GYP domain-containing protein (c-di-GMP phosphodiesterase class II)